MYGLHSEQLILITIIFLNCVVAEEKNNLNDEADRAGEGGVDVWEENSVLERIGTGKDFSLLGRNVPYGNGRMSSNRKTLSSDSELLSRSMEPADKTPSFTDWQSWPSKYPMCNPNVNAKQSPIKINTKQAVPDKETPTLFVYSGPPIKDYTFTPEFHGEPDFNMTAFTLAVKDNRHHEATYVTGLGDRSYRFFMYAFFLFSKGNKDPRQSLHQIDGKTFPLEIVMYFSTTRTDDDTTQVHVMVNISQVENPLFVPVVRAAEKIAERKTKLNENTEKELTQRNKVIEMYTKLTGETKQREDAGFYTTVDKLQQAIIDVKVVESNLRQYTAEENRLTGIIHSIDASITKCTNEKADAEAKLQVIANKISELKGQMDPNNVEGTVALEKEVDKLANEGTALEATLLSKQKCINASTNEKSVKEAELDGWAVLKMMIPDDIVAAFDNNGVGSLGLTGSADAKEKLKEFQKILDEDLKAKTELYSELSVLKQYQDELTFQVGLGMFQISWLLPPIGGHYIYDGSLPVPPCTPRGFTIVMEQVVSISQQQYNAIVALGGLPGLEELKESVPVLADLGDRKVRYNKKNLQYILDDGVHMKSKLRKKLKDKMRQGCDCVYGNTFGIWIAISVSLLLR